MPGPGAVVFAAASNSSALSVTVSGVGAPPAMSTRPSGRRVAVVRGAGFHHLRSLGPRAALWVVYLKIGDPCVSVRLAAADQHPAVDEERCGVAADGVGHGPGSSPGAQVGDEYLGGVRRPIHADPSRGQNLAVGEDGYRMKHAGGDHRRQGLPLARCRRQDVRGPGRAEVFPHAPGHEHAAVR